MIGEGLAGQAIGKLVDQRVCSPPGMFGRDADWVIPEIRPRRIRKLRRKADVVLLIVAAQAELMFLVLVVIELSYAGVPPQRCRRIEAKACGV